MRMQPCNKNVENAAEKSKFLRYSAAQPALLSEFFRIFILSNVAPHKIKEQS